MAKDMELKRVLWIAKLDSDFNERYWRLVTEKYTRRDFSLKLFLAVTTSGTVAGWSFWAEYPIVWQSLSALSAVASIASPLLAYGKKVEAAASHAGKWVDLRIRYNELWESWLSNVDHIVLNQEHMKLKNTAIELASSEPGMKISMDNILSKRAQHEVLRANGLLSEGLL